MTDGKPAYLSTFTGKPDSFLLTYCPAGIVIIIQAKVGNGLYWAAPEILGHP